MKDLELIISNNIRRLDTVDPDPQYIIEILQLLNERISQLTNWTKEVLDEIRSDIRSLEDEGE